MRLAAMFGMTVLTAAPLFAGWDDDCRYTAAKRAATSAAGVTRVVIEAGAGLLSVEGAPGATQVVATGTACTSDEDFLPKMNVTLRKVGSELHIDSTLPETKVVFGFFTARLDLSITLPAGIPVTIEDGSGSIAVSRTGALEIRDGSGSIEVREVAGDVGITDGSGEITLRNVKGSVEIEDGSGSIDVADIEGSVRVGADGSGSIAARAVRGDMIVDRDSSGSIDVADIRGNFSVGRKGSGPIDHVRVAGTIALPDRHRD